LRETVVDKMLEMRRDGNCMQELQRQRADRCQRLSPIVEYHRLYVPAAVFLPMVASPAMAERKGQDVSTDETDKSV